MGKMKSFWISLILFHCWVTGYIWEPLNYKESLEANERCKKMNSWTGYKRISFMDTQPEGNEYIFECLFYECGLFTLRRGWMKDRVHAQLQEWSKIEKDAEGLRSYETAHVNYCFRHDNPKESWHLRTYKLYECGRTTFDRYKFERDQAETNRILSNRRHRLWNSINNGLNSAPFWFRTKEEQRKAINDFYQLEWRETHIAPPQVIVENNEKNEDPNIASSQTTENPLIDFSQTTENPE